MSISITGQNRKFTIIQREQTTKKWPSRQKLRVGCEALEVRRRNPTHMRELQRSVKTAQNHKKKSFMIKLFILYYQLFCII